MKHVSLAGRMTGIFYMFNVLALAQIYIKRLDA